MPIRKPSKNYNSDYMSRKCDEQLEQLEDRLTALYANATNDVLSEYTDWISQYEKQDASMRAKLDEGKIDEDEYLDWRRNKMLNNQKYKETVKSLTDVLVNTDIAAMAMVDGELPLVIAESYNFVQSLGYDAADKAGLSVGSFQVYNARSVQEIVKKNPDLLPVVDIPEDQKWNKDRINREITQGIIKGDSIPKIANRLQGVTNMDKNAAIRNARTAMTGAENLGRNEGFQDLKEKGIPCKLQWSATHDDRTRDTHIRLDGTYQNDDGYFGEGIISTPIQYPGDPAGDPEEVYNCRCRASLRLQGVDHSQDGDLYEKFMKENYPEDWSKVKEQREEKEQAFQESKARLEAAEISTPEVAEAVAEPVKAEETPIETIKEAEKMPSVDELLPEEKHESVKRGIVEGKNISTTWKRKPDEYEFEIDDIVSSQGFNGLPRVVSSEEFDKAVKNSNFIAQRTYSAPDQETLDKYRNDLYYGQWYIDCSVGGSAHGQGMYCAGNYDGKLTDEIKTEMQDYIRQNKAYTTDEAPYYIETLTIDPSAKFLEIPKNKDDFEFVAGIYYNQSISLAGEKTGQIDEANEILELKNQIGRNYDNYLNNKISENEFYSNFNKFNDEINLILESNKELKESIDEERSKITNIKDVGSMAALMGYDGIRTHYGTSGADTIILNRTKIIFKGE